MRVAIVPRNPLHSPQMQSNDAAILGAVERELVQQGHTVERLGEGDDYSGYDIICNMSRTHDVLLRLKKAEAEGRIVLNSPEAVERCSRSAMTTILEKNNIPQPTHKHITCASDLCTAPYPAWIKKSEGWSCRIEDVAYITNSKEAAEAFNTIKSNEGCNAILFEHIAGDLIKFYGVGGRYFSHSYPAPEKTKFGLEKINGSPKHHAFSTQKLESTAFLAAKALGLEIFGGDAIITPDGEIFIIDINDFPSFTAVRDEAAAHIAKAIINAKKDIND